ncbi:SDR family oxidoreductase [Pseudomaricurvus alkylphenolicus]|uniref:SDR family NAD(P)-dependent oxidoreductase n=1 Tax=Pseudomaricurvus alkylphenolicus TaxID=1306991 RepID=UPI0014246DD9|nr:SDR family NAD(P)-dependent oxidoreductase [Pseudomaricurvus alkylphenolicus]NIB42252.1 SDR family oxidoreductase [Pseudomaricurvus alkylphenolicus]
MDTLDFSVSLKGKVAIVTGAKGGIGRAVALLLASSGADVVITDIHAAASQIETVAEKIRDRGVRCVSITADITRKNDLDQLLGDVLNEFGSVDLLVNVAGVYLSNPLLDFDEERWNTLFDVNLKGVFLACQSVAKIMVQQESGCIINISSDSALDVAEGDGPYSASKSGVIAITRHLSKELGKFNVRANAIAPGWVKTEMTEFVWRDPQLLKEAEAQIPLGYIAEPRDIANVALFLASEASRYVTGQVIVANGGRV